MASGLGSSLTYYRDVVVYEHTNNLSYIVHPLGLICKSGSGYVYDYFLKDHLGSTRVMVEASGNQLTNVQAIDYYPYGLAFTFANLSLNKYLYSGKEFQDASLGGELLGLYDFGSRFYDPMLGRWFCQDPALQLMSPYIFCGNNPMMFIDPDGEFAWLAFGIGAIIDLWTGGTVANDGNMNPAKWDWQSRKTWGFMFGGAAIGGLSGALGGVISAQGGVLANTNSIMGASFVNSLGMTAMTKGEVMLGISFGVASFDLGSGFNYLGKKGNKFIQNLGYGLGGLANLSDILAGLTPAEVQLNTESSDKIGHSALTNVGEQNNSNSLVSVGPDPGGKWIFNPFKFKKGTNEWTNYIEQTSDVMKTVVKGVNKNRILAYGGYLDKGVKYNLYFSSCVNHTARALTISGAPAIGIHPFVLYTQIYLRSIGIRPMLYSYHLIK